MVYFTMLVLLVVALAAQSPEIQAMVVREAVTAFAAQSVHNLLDHSPPRLPRGAHPRYLVRKAKSNATG
jgi:hypothetical protein